MIVCAPSTCFWAMIVFYAKSEIRNPGPLYLWRRSMRTRLLRQLARNFDSPAVAIFGPVATCGMDEVARLSVPWLTRALAVGSKTEGICVQSYMRCCHHFETYVLGLVSPTLAVQR